MKQTNTLKLYIILITVALLMTVFLDFFRTTGAHVLAGQGGWNETPSAAFNTVMQIFGMVLIGEIIGSELQARFGESKKKHSKPRLGIGVFIGTTLALLLITIGCLFLNQYTLFIGSAIVFVVSLGALPGFKIRASLEKLEEIYF